MATGGGPGLADDPTGFTTRANPRMINREHQGPAMSEASASVPVIIRRYARSRLYDAAHGRYVSMDTLRLWQARGIAFMVLDAETGADITRVLMA